MAGTLRVHDWHQFQHYKDRNPSWIKLHKELLDSYKFQRLPVDSRALAPMIWLLASESKDGTLDYDIQKISFRLRMSALELEAAIVPLISGGFLDLSADAIAPLAEPERASSPEKETEREKESEAEKKGAPSAAPVVKRETSNTKRKGTRLEVDAEPDEQDIRYARDEYGWSAERIAIEWTSIRDWSRSSRNGVKLDWHAAWRQWVRRREAEQPTRSTRTRDRRAAIVAALGDELAGNADGTVIVGRDGAPDGPGTGDAPIIDVVAGGDGEALRCDGVRGGDGSTPELGGDDGNSGGRQGSDSVVPLDARRPAGGSADDGDRTNDPNARVPQPTETGAYPGARLGGIGETARSADHSASGDGTDPFDIPEFLRRKAG